MTDPLDLAICATCGTQFSVPSLSSCKICDDPRQYIPPTGQSWTTLRTLQSSQTYHNDFVPDMTHPDTLIAIHTTPKLGIGQSAYLCRSPAGNILWDCITYIDDETIARIEELGGLAAIVISHPHYFSTNLHWAETFNCPVYLSIEDEEWLMRRGPQQVLWEGSRLSLPAGLAGADFEAVKTGGHFPGSSVLWWKSLRMLLIADTIMVVPSGIYHVDRLPGTTSFSFLWSYPNMIPLPPGEVHNIWKAIKHTDFDETRGAFKGQATHGDSKKRVLESAKIVIKAMGYLDHAIHQEESS
ncbi:hypothetical protein FE257_002927 [Aspergillus nanangensis]|uniref:Metallo-beta-lactamase domain-containing protein n=1 Tax=Aspergillus nanangensis TaxID=2582783 RepID=A0AAD4CSM3_ASPNN|nr:hypothetical protein FE257_002927 [Aspergillus nanangensis]